MGIVLTQSLQNLQDSKVVFKLMLIVEYSVSEVDIPSNLLSDGVALWHLNDLRNHLQEALLVFTEQVFNREPRGHCVHQLC